MVRGDTRYAYTQSPASSVPTIAGLPLTTTTACTWQLVLQQQLLPAAAERATSMYGEATLRSHDAGASVESERGMERVLRTFLGRSPNETAEIFISAPNQAGSLNSSSAASASKQQPTHSCNPLLSLPPPSSPSMSQPNQKTNRRVGGYYSCNVLLLPQMLQVAKREP